MSIDLPTPPRLALKACMLPRDTNQHGTIFGGVLLSHIDQAGAVGAGEVLQEAGLPVPPLVTVSMNEVEFDHPVRVGDIVSYWTQVKRIGNTSISVHVAVESAGVQVTKADVTYVAVADEGEGPRPVPVWPISP